MALAGYEAATRDSREAQALKVAGGDAELAREVLSTWERCPPPDFTDEPAVVASASPEGLQQKWPPQQRHLGSTSSRRRTVSDLTDITKVGALRSTDRRASWSASQPSTPSLAGQVMEVKDVAAGWWKNLGELGSSIGKSVDGLARAADQELQAMLGAPEKVTTPRAKQRDGFEDFFGYGDAEVSPVENELADTECLASRMRRLSSKDDGGESSMASSGDERWLGGSETSDKEARSCSSKCSFRRTESEPKSADEQSCPVIFMHLPDADLDCDDVQVLSSSGEDASRRGPVDLLADAPMNRGGGSVAEAVPGAAEVAATLKEGVQSVWGALRQMSTLFPADNGTGSSVPSPERWMKKRSAAAAVPDLPRQEDPGLRRKVEIESLLAKGWMAPADVRQLKQELAKLQELQEKRSVSMPPGSTAELLLTPAAKSNADDEVPFTEPQPWNAHRWTTPGQLRSTHELHGEQRQARGLASAASNEVVPNVPRGIPASWVSGVAGGPPGEATLEGDPGASSTTPEAGASRPAEVPWQSPANGTSSSDAKAESTQCSAVTSTPPSTVLLQVPALETGVAQSSAALPSSVPMASNSDQADARPSAVSEPTAGASEGAIAKAKSKGKGKGKGPPPPGSGPPGNAPGPAPPPPHKGDGLEDEKATVAMKAGVPKKAPPPPPKGKAAAKAKAGSSKARAPPPLFGRRLEWQSLTAEKVEGTVFAGLVGSGGEVAVDVGRLRALFEKPKVAAKAKQEVVPKKREVVKLLSDKRAQNIAIALRRQPLDQTLCQALEIIDVDASVLRPEACEVLMGAIPSPEEAKLLLGYQGNPEDLREVERLLLPLARLEKPAAGQRLRAILFGRTMADLATDLRKGLQDLRIAFEDACRSEAFRIVLRHTKRLGNVINYGATKTEEDVAAGFSLEALPRLAQFKAASDHRITLMHVLVAQVSTADQNMRQLLVEELGSARHASKFEFSPFVEGIAAFRREAMHLTSLKSFAQISGEDKIGPLSERAVNQAGALEEALASARESAKAALAYFAVSAPAAKDVDTKGVELLRILGVFLDSFERTAQELTAHPKLAKLCHGECGSAGLESRGSATAAATEAASSATCQRTMISGAEEESA